MDQTDELREQEKLVTSSEPHCSLPAAWCHLLPQIAAARGPTLSALALCAPTDAELLVLAGLAAQFSVLRRLDLQQSVNITDEGVRALAALTTLAELILPASARQVEYVPTSEGFTPSRPPRITPAVVAEVQAALPNCRITFEPALRANLERAIPIRKSIEARPLVRTAEAIPADNRCVHGDVAIFCAACAREKKESEEREEREERERKEKWEAEHCPSCGSLRAESYYRFERRGPSNAYGQSLSLGWISGCRGCDALAEQRNAPARQKAEEERLRRVEEARLQNAEEERLHPRRVERELQPGEPVPQAAPQTAPKPAEEPQTTFPCPGCGKVIEWHLSCPHCAYTPWYVAFGGLLLALGCLVGSIFLIQTRMEGGTMQGDPTWHFWVGLCGVLVGFIASLVMLAMTVKVILGMLGIDRRSGLSLGIRAVLILGVLGSLPVLYFLAAHWDTRHKHDLARQADEAIPDLTLSRFQEQLPRLVPELRNAEKFSPPYFAVTNGVWVLVPEGTSRLEKAKTVLYIDRRSVTTNPGKGTYTVTACFIDIANPRRKRVVEVTEPISAGSTADLPFRSSLAKACAEVRSD